MQYEQSKSGAERSVQKWSSTYLYRTREEKRLSTDPSMPVPDLMEELIQSIFVRTVPVGDYMYVFEALSYRHLRLFAEESLVHLPFRRRRSVLNYHFPQLPLASFGIVLLQLIHRGLVQINSNHRADGWREGGCTLSIPCRGLLVVIAAFRLCYLRRILYLTGRLCERSSEPDGKEAEAINNHYCQRSSGGRTYLRVVRLKQLA